MDRRSLLALPLTLLGERHASVAIGPRSSTPSRHVMRQGHAANVPMLGGNPARTGEHPGPGPAGQPRVRWRYQTNGEVLAAPAVVDGVVYVGSMDGHLYALNADTGAERWRFESGDGLLMTPTIANGLAYLTWFEALAAVDLTTGWDRWFYFTAGPVVSSPAVHDGAVYVTGDTRVYVADAESGKERWTLDTGGVFFDSSPAIAADMLFVSTTLPEIDHAVCRAYDLATRRERWHFETAGSFDSTLVVAGDTVYLGAWDGYLYALDAASGGERWQFPIGTKEVSRPAVADGIVYVGGAQTLYAVEAASGQERWRLAGTEGYPVVAGDTVYAGGWNGPLVAVDTATGAERWRLDVGGVAASPVVTGGVVFVGGRDGSISALGA